MGIKECLKQEGHGQDVYGRLISRPPAERCACSGEDSPFHRHVGNPG